jgi:hypothetical protein
MATISVGAGFLRCGQRSESCRRKRRRDHEQAELKLHSMYSFSPEMPQVRIMTSLPPEQFRKV